MSRDWASGLRHTNVGNCESTGCTCPAYRYPPRLLTIPVPDGMTVDEATERLARPADVEWVPLPDGPTREHIGKRLRVRFGINGHGVVQDYVDDVVKGKVTWMNGAGSGWGALSGFWYIHPDDVPDADAELVEWVPMDWDDIPEGARWKHSGTKGGEPAMRRPFLVHPDDVPQEPEHDPALVEHIARAVHKAAREEKPWDDLPRYVRQQFLDDAEAALTAVREYEARR